MAKKTKTKSKKEVKKDSKIEVIRVIQPNIEILKKESKKESKSDKLEDFLEDYEDFSKVPNVKGFKKTSLEQSENIDNLEKEVEGVPINKPEENSTQFSYESLKSGGGYIEATSYQTNFSRGSYETTNSSTPQLKSRNFSFINPDFEMNKENDKYDHHKHYSSETPDEEESPFKSSKEKKRQSF